MAMFVPVKEERVPGGLTGDTMQRERHAALRGLQNASTNETVAVGIVTLLPVNAALWRGRTHTNSHTKHVSLPATPQGRVQVDDKHGI